MPEDVLEDIAKSYVDRYEYDDIEGFKVLFYRDIYNEARDVARGSIDDDLDTVLRGLNDFDRLVLRTDDAGFYEDLQEYVKTYQEWTDLAEEPAEEDDLFHRFDRNSLTAQKFVGRMRDDLVQADDAYDFAGRLDERDYWWDSVIRRHYEEEDDWKQAFWDDLNSGDPSLQTVAEKQKMVRSYLRQSAMDIATTIEQKLPGLMEGSNDESNGENDAS